MELRWSLFCAFGISLSYPLAILLRHEAHINQIDIQKQTKKESRHTTITTHKPTHVL